MVCGVNRNYQFGNEKNKNIYNLTELSQFNNCKYISTNGVRNNFY